MCVSTFLSFFMRKKYFQVDLFSIIRLSYWKCIFVLKIKFPYACFTCYMQIVLNIMTIKLTMIKEYRELSVIQKLQGYGLMKTIR